MTGRCCILCSPTNQSFVSLIGWLPGRAVCSKTFSVKNAHHSTTRSFDFNPNKQVVLRSCFFVPNSLSFFLTGDFFFFLFLFASCSQYDLVTSGDDGLVKFWDVRSLTQPVLMVGAHTHWFLSKKGGFSFSSSPCCSCTVSISSVAGCVVCGTTA